MAKGEGTVRVHGVQACLAVFRARPGDVRRAWVTQETIPALGDMLRGLARRHRPYKVVHADEVARVAGAVHHEGICIEAREAPAPSWEALRASLSATRGSARLVFLDGVANPHNLGAIVRTAAHFGAAAVLGADGQLPPMRGAACRIAEGGAEHVPVLGAARPEGALGMLAEAGVVPVATGHEGGEDLFAGELPPQCMFLLGAEGTGLSARMRHASVRHVRIPGTGAVESLNVSAACAVLLAEHYRRFN